MKEEIKKLEIIQDDFEHFMDLIYRKHNSANKQVIFAAMIIKKANDILNTAIHTLKGYVISVQISLLRLMCDNCLAIQSAMELGLDKYIEMIDSNQKINTIMVDEEQAMTDGYLKRLVAKTYKGFDKLYNFACEGVHFSKQALGSAFLEENGKISMNIKVGNKKMEKDLIYNNSQMLVLCRVIVDMLKRICLQ